MDTIPDRGWTPEMSAPTTESASLPENTLVRSAFAHSLRNSAPRPFSDFLEHWACALLHGRYIVHAQQDPEDAESLSLALHLPSYESEEEMREGFVVIAEGTELTEKAQAAFEDVAQNNTPAAMLAELSKGPLQAVFEYICSQAPVLGDSPALPALKRGKSKALAEAMHALSQQAEALSSARLPDLDPFLAEAEVSIVNAFRNDPAATEEFKAYFDRVLELHAALKEDSEAALEDLMAPPQAHDHDHEHEHDHEHGGCCGHHH